MTESNPQQTIFLDMSNMPWLMSLDPCERCQSPTYLTLINWRYPKSPSPLETSSPAPVVIDAINIPAKMCTNHDCRTRYVPRNVMDQIYYQALNHHLMEHSPKLADRLTALLVGFEDK